MTDSKHKIDRRSFMQAMAQAGTAVVFLPTGSAIAAPKKRFLLYIHCGSWDGLAAGLVQPPDASGWPTGVFDATGNKSRNPLINQLKKSGRMVFHGYSQCLAELVPHMCAAVGSSQTVNHNEGQFLQATGGRQGSPNPSWVAGAAQAFAGSDPRALIVGATNFSTHQTYLTPKVGLLGGNSVDQFNTTFVDVPQIGGGATAAEYWKVLASLNNSNDQSPGWVPDNVRSSLNTYLVNLTSGNLPIPADIKAEVEAAINASVVNKIVDDAMGNNDAVATKNITNEDVRRTFNRQTLLARMQLAAGLIKSGTASGMSILLDGQDLHFGGSSVYTARSAALTFAHVVALWRWIKAQGMADDVMIVMSHDFTRSAYNSNKIAYEIEVDDGKGGSKKLKVECPGTDHHTAMGMLVLNGKMGQTPGIRLGGLANGFNVTGSENAQGMPKAGLAPYRSVDIIGSLMMRCFPDLFPNPRAVSDSWKTFQNPISYIT